MTNLELLVSIFALFNGSGMDIKIERTQDGVSVKLYSACGKESSFYVPHAADYENTCYQMSLGLRRLAEARNKALFEAKGSK